MKRLVLILAILLVLGLAGYFLWERGHQEAPNTLRLSGHMEATETDLAFKVPGKIAAIKFEEGDWIKAGQVAALLEDQDLRQDVAQAEAALGTARANLDKLLAGSRPQEKKEAQAQVGQAQADLTDKEREYRRMQALYERATVSAQTRDKAQAAFLMAREAHRRAAENYSLVKEGPRKEDIEAGRTELKRAQAALELARTRLGYATITAPVNGVVLVRPAEPGEVVAVGSPVLTMGDLDNIYFEGYIPESDHDKVRLGMKAEIISDSGKKYPAWVSFINNKAEFTPKTVETFKERVTLVYRTKIRANNPNYELKPGMPANAVIFLDQK